MLSIGQMILIGLVSTVVIAIAFALWIMKAMQDAESELRHY